MAREVVPDSEVAKSWSLEPIGRLVHLRWAVAEIAIGIETPSAGLEAAERALAIFAQRAVALIQSLESDGEALDDACYAAQLAIGEARSALPVSSTLRAERARALHEVRRKLHRALVLVVETMARGRARCTGISGFDDPELASLLTLRQMFSGMRGGLISAGEQRSRLSWALEVASAELGILLANPALNDLPLRSQQAITELARRVTDWGLREPDPILGRSLYREATTIPSMAGQLSSHPALVEHDERALSELASLLAHEPSGALLEARALAQLCALRGLDPELDRLELQLLYGAVGALGSLSVRVAELRAGFARPTQSAASWS